MAGRAVNDGPLVIGGAGGSGTRVYMAIAERAGYQMLTAPWLLRLRQHDWHDNFLMSKFFYTRWINRYLKGELSAAAKARMGASCRCLLWLSGPTSYGRGKWGWKNPRSRFLIPYFQELYPNMRFIHVVRDGRDHVFHPRFSYDKHQDCLLSGEELSLPDHLRIALFWSRTHRLTEQMAEEHLAGRYIASRLEDLCADPEKEIGRLLAFLGTEDRETGRQAARLVCTPKSLGRWHNESQQKIMEVEDLIGNDLLRYGYPLGADARASS